ncbi:SDR family NAD(P)-dependent oxidoreductase [Bordetella petrii]|uniref:SDR family NAD(P)-dependent oxidoreductase n=1 Tax=Bordetella petrii TaxID=94624 RepID=UPI001E4AABBF|nr:3-oxoacyl-ACP reductase family protein [Bordetella petrii]MCD0505545.1 3-oxoacyl-ACP reductase FabG [Bordetella petrii]
MTDLTGKTALVTGASRGIGAAIARHLAARGADVAITYVSSPGLAEELAQELRAAGRRAQAYAADAANPQQVQAVVARAAQDLGGLDILVNNAGVFIPGDLAAMPYADYQRTMDVNVGAVFGAIQAALPHLPDGGRIINIGSCLAGRTGAPGLSVYSASKSALVGLTKGVARDLGARGITVNVVHPGPIDTDMNPANHEGAAELAAGLALGRYGHVDDIAAMVAYLASPAAGYVTGAEFSVDGGFSA